MAKRVIVKEGDVFGADLGNHRMKYLQYVMLDPSEMNSEVIRVFKRESTPVTQPDLEIIAQSEVDFYAHVVVKWGVQMGLWQKIGHVPIENNFEPPYFRSVPLTPKNMEGNKIIFCKTKDWQAWQAGQKFEDRKPIGYLNEETGKYHLGGVIPPAAIIERMKTGSYSQPYFT
jgi:hypothetical protein